MQTRSVEPTHLRAARLRASDIEAMYRIDEALAAPEAGLVVVVDDLLTSGAHFRAAQRVLSRHFPDIDVAGLFLARRVMEAAAGAVRRAVGIGVGTGKDAISRKPAERAASNRRDAGVKIVSVINYKGGVGENDVDRQPGGGARPLRQARSGPGHGRPMQPDLFVRDAGHLGCRTGRRGRGA